MRLEIHVGRHLFGVAALEQAPPGTVKHQGGDGQPAHQHGVAAAEHAVPHPPLQHAGKQGARTHHDIVVIEGSQLGEIARLGGDQARQAFQPRIAQYPPVAPQQVAQQGERIFVARFGQFLGSNDVGHHGIFHHGPEQGLLALVVEEHRALGNAGAARDVFHARGGEAFLAEHLKGGGEKLGRACLLATLAQGGNRTHQTSQRITY